MCILLATIYYLAEISNNKKDSIQLAVAALMVGSVCVMFVYHPWFVQYVVLGAAGVGTAAARGSGK